MTAAVYTIESQRPAGIVDSRRTYTDHERCKRALARAISRCRLTGFVVVLKDGREITYAALRGLECAP